MCFGTPNKPIPQPWLEGGIQPSPELQVPSNPKPSTVRALQRHWLLQVERVGDGEESDDVIGVRGWRAPREPSSKIPFQQPVRRPRRIRTADNRTSFSFAFASVTKVRALTETDGQRLRPGAARAHCQYIERGTAVAAIDPQPIGEIIERLADVTTFLGTGPDQHHHHDNQHEETYNDVDSARSRALAQYAGIITSLVQQDALKAGRPDPFASPNLRGLPRRDLGNGERQAGLLVPDEGWGELAGGQDEDPGDVRLAGGADRGVQQPPDGSLNGSRGTRRSAEQHQAYLERPSALAVQPDGERALFTNIDPDPVERLRFWALVEEHESNPSPDTMTFDIAKAPDFWRNVAEGSNCPTELKAAIEADDPKARQDFRISSGYQVRAFLERQPGWIGNRKKAAGETREAYSQSRNPLASFRDGRGGRTQYRIIGELPNELSIKRNLAILKSIAKELEEKGLPFVLVMHAPDHANDERNWHFHLDVYDRPCRRITAEDIAWARCHDYDADCLNVGDWDFAATTFKGGRRDRTTRPFLQKKVDDLKKDGAIEAWRFRLAQLANQALAEEGQTRRFDPRSYKEMGIKAEPGEHLGTNASAAEGKGEITPKGVANEAKQWRAVMTELEERLAADTAAVRHHVGDRRDRLDGADLPVSQRADVTRKIDELELALLQAADCDNLAEEVHETTARMCSRPNFIHRVNTRWIEADEDGERVMSGQERRTRESLLADATQYLDGIKPLVSHGGALIAASQAEASDLRRRAGEIDSQLDEILRGGASRSAAPVPPGRAPVQAIAPAKLAAVAFVPDSRLLVTSKARIVIPSPPTDQPSPSPTAEVPPSEMKAVRGRQARGFGTLMQHPSSEHARSLRRTIQSGQGDEGARKDRSRANSSRNEGASGPGVPGAGGGQVPITRNVSTGSGSMEVGAVAGPLPSDAVQASADRERELPAAGRPATSGNSGGPEGRSPPAVRESLGDDGARLPALGPLALTGTTDQNRPLDDAPKAAQSDHQRLVEAKTIDPDRARPSRGQLAQSPHAPPGIGAGGGERVEETGEGPVRQSNILDIVPDPKVKVRLDRDGLVDLDHLAAQGFAIPDDQRSNPRLVGKARAQALYAAERIAAFVAKAPYYVEKVEGQEDVYRLSSKAQFTVVGLLRDHDGPELQSILRSAARGHPPAAAPVVATGIEQTAIETVASEVRRVTTLRVDDAMIAEARRHHEAKREQAAAEAASEEARANRRSTGGGGRSEPAPGSKDIVYGDAARAARRARDDDRFKR